MENGLMHGLSVRVRQNILPHLRIEISFFPFVQCVKSRVCQLQCYKCIFFKDYIIKPHSSCAQITMSLLRNSKQFFSIEALRFGDFTDTKALKTCKKLGDIKEQSCSMWSYF
jgi:hypothetical protein